MHLEKCDIFLLETSLIKFLKNRIVKISQINLTTNNQSKFKSPRMKKNCEKSKATSE